MARNNEPAFRRKTPLLICSIRTEIPYPCIGSNANVFRMSISSVPWTRSLGLSGINLLPLGYQEENTLLLLVVKIRVMRGLDFRSQSERTFFGRAREKFAADVDESMITGESKTLPKRAGARVIAGTVASGGNLRVRISEIGA